MADIDMIMVVCMPVRLLVDGDCLYCGYVGKMQGCDSEGMSGW